MNREEIIRMARETGKTNWYGTKPDGTKDFLGAEFTPEQLERFAALVAAAQREADAVVCDWLPINDPHGQWHNDDMIQASLICAAAIRARGDK